MNNQQDIGHILLMGQVLMRLDMIAYSELYDSWWSSSTAKWVELPDWRAAWHQQ
jgi:hypothetical protein